MRAIFIVMSVLMLSACTKVGLQLANLPAKFSDNRIIKNIVFDDASKQKLDVYIPAKQESSPYPVIVFFYGGRWESGSKDMYAFLGNKLANKGFVTVIADYRKYPQVRFPVFVQDGAKALAWVDDHIQEYGGDRNKIVVAGHSAGAHIGALLTADERYLEALGKHHSVITAFVGLAGPYDFVPKADDLKAIFAPPEQYSQMQVTTFIDGREPPMLLLWGDKDKEVGRQNLDALVKKCRQKGVVVESKIYSGVGHVDILANQMWFYPGKATALNDMTEFIH
ncbi:MULTISPECIES: alpha/beta hydrolase [Vibrio]|uniref:Alpha/beta hydrolase fold domain-containing protein n=2 Tax=Vibrio TaxID=662 RepID=A0A7X4RWY4_9VIBR|nr:MULTISPECIES: alpha/beta hydrolase [Vibrio]MBF9000643.1 alpha/beta hydrolase [Vibrio nitrifigilis]MZI95875.1 alpha/beta hydrolase fold domain-containing protein [Vibrio eleionomae]